MSPRPGLVALLVAVTAGALAACAGEDPERGPVRIGVVAAPSLSAAFTEMIGIFEAEHPGTRVSLELGRSDALARELAGRTDVNIFASASEEAMDEVVEAGAAVDPTLFARNHVVLAVPSGNPRGVTTLADLARPDLRVGLCALDFPCGKAADTLLDAAGVDPASVPRSEGSRALASRLAGNELDAGIVYSTDVASSHGWVTQAEVGEQERELAAAAGTTRYVVARVPGGEDGPDAEAERVATEEFLELVTSDRGRRALEDAGLGALPA